MKAITGYWAKQTSPFYDLLRKYMTEVKIAKMSAYLFMFVCYFSQFLAAIFAFIPFVNRITNMNNENWLIYVCNTTLLSCYLFLLLLSCWFFFVGVHKCSDIFKPSRYMFCEPSYAYSWNDDDDDDDKNLKDKCLQCLTDNEYDMQLAEDEITKYLADRKKAQNAWLRSLFRLEFLLEEWTNFNPNIAKGCDYINMTDVNGNLLKEFKDLHSKQKELVWRTTDFVENMKICKRDVTRIRNKLAWFVHHGYSEEEKKARVDSLVKYERSVNDDQIMENDINEEVDCMHENTKTPPLVKINTKYNLFWRYSLTPKSLKVEEIKGKIRL